jgi:hypothetical protein
MADIEFIPFTPLSAEYLAEVKRERTRNREEMYRMCMIPREILEAAKKK